MGEEIYGCFVKMKTLEKCEICGKSAFKFLFKQRDKNLNFWEDFQLYKCKNCGVIFLNPQPSNKELEKYYPKERYYSLGGIDKNSSKTKLKIFLYNLYFNQERKNYLLKILFSPIKFMIRGTKIVKGEKILDVGCGSGQFLYEMKRLGVDSCGTEPGEFDEKGAKEEGLYIKKTTLEKAGLKENAFDIVTLNQVLEHVNNPNKTLKEIYRILRKNGLFIVGVPNYRSLAKKIFGKNWYQFDVPRHLFNFSDKLLIRLLKKNNFKIILNRHNSRPSQFVVSLEYLLNRRFSRFTKSILTGVFLPLTWIVNSLKLGDQFEIWCVKI